MNKMPPLVTVAIPTFNRLELLKRAVSSVLAQRYENLEIVISDNASSDGTDAYLAGLRDSRLRIRFNRENLGMVANWDECLEMSNGEYFLLMSDDDALLDCDAITKLVRGFETGTDKSIGVVFCDVMLELVSADQHRETSSNKTKLLAGEAIADFFQNRLSILPCATLFRTRDLLSLGGYGAFGAKLAVDACAWISLAMMYGGVTRVAEPLVLYRVHQSLSSSTVSVWDDEYKVMVGIIDSMGSRKLSKQDHRRAKKAMMCARDRVPIAYMVRKYQDDKSYGYRGLIGDIWKWRYRLLTAGNLVFMFAHVAKNIRARMSCPIGQGVK